MTGEHAGYSYAEIFEGCFWDRVETSSIGQHNGTPLALWLDEHIRVKTEGLTIVPYQWRTGAAVLC